MSLLRRVGLRRTGTLVNHAKPRVDKAVLRRAVMARDGECVAHKLGFEHECRDVVGTPHAPTETYRLSMERVKDALRMGHAADYDLRHTVAACYAINWQPPTKEMRAAFRVYLAEVNP